MLKVSYVIGYVISTGHWKLNTRVASSMTKMCNSIHPKVLSLLIKTAVSKSSSRTSSESDKHAAATNLSAEPGLSSMHLRNFLVLVSLF